MKKMGIMALIAIFVLSIFLAGCGNEEALQAQINTLTAEKTKTVEDNNRLEEMVNVVNEENIAYKTAVEDLAKEIDIIKQEKIDEEKAKNETRDAEETVKTQVANLCEYSDEYSIGDDLEKMFNDNKLSFLKDAKVRLDGEKYDFHETISFTDDLKIVSSGFNGKAELGAEPYIIFDGEGAISYNLIFDDPIPEDEISSEEPLLIELLGEELEIVEVDGNEATVRRGIEVELEEGQSQIVTINGKEVEVTALTISDASSKAKFKVDGKLTKAMTDGQTDDVGDYYIAVISVVPNEAEEETGGDLVWFKIGEKEAMYDIESGTFLDEDTKYWKWEINTVAGELTGISIVLDQRGNDLDDDLKPIKAGQSIDIAGIAKLTFKEVLNTDYKDIRLSFAEYGQDDDVVLVFDGNFEIDDKEVSKVMYNGTIWYYTYDGDKYNTTENPTFVNDEAEFEIAQVAPNLIRVGDYLVDVRFDLFVGDEGWFGAEKEKSEEGDIQVLPTGQPIGTEDEDVLSIDGMIVENPDEDLENDKLTFRVPNDQVEMKICLGR